ncbi:MAG: ATP-binding cassette domain-containing protein [Candidatus Promineifilaceae bacterium]
MAALDTQKASASIEMIETKDLTKRFDDFTAVDQLTLKIPPGQVLALLGPNGAGKTTTVRMLSAILRPTAGCAWVNGRDVVEDADRVRRDIGLLTEQPGLYTRSTGIEYLQFFGSLYGMNAEDSAARANQLLNRFGMEEHAGKRLGEYSKGMRQKIGLIRAMLHKPTVLLLDEPTSAMDPHSAKLVRDTIMELRNDHRAILVCTHNLAEAEMLADRIAIISRGKIITEGDPASLKRKLVGDRLFELTVNREIDLALNGVKELVQVDKIDGPKLHYRTNNPEEINPKLVRLLSDGGFGIISLEEQSASLEQVYLEVVEADINRSPTTINPDITA